MDGWTRARHDRACADRDAFALARPRDQPRSARAEKVREDQQKDIDKALKQIRDAFQIARAYWQARNKAVQRLRI